jgi:hypothetical protein
MVGCPVLRVLIVSSLPSTNNAMFGATTSNPQPMMLMLFLVHDYSNENPPTHLAMCRGKFD